MRFFIIWTLLVVALFFVLPSDQPGQSPTTTQKHTISPTPTPLPPGYSVFVPYWQLPDSPFTPTSPVEQKTIPTANIYFSITPDKNARITKNTAYKLTPTFTQLAPKPHILTLAMTQEDITTPILRDKKLQKKLIAETIQLAKKHSFKGILLDLEHSVLPFREVRTSITQFNALFSESAHKNNLSFSITLYGDTYYRSRPYDVADLEPHADHIFVMAYDFHKSFGTPGPNFPYSCSEVYSYCFTRMIDDFLHDIPAYKLSIVYGMFGYTWEVDDQNRPIKPAKAETYAQLIQPTSCPQPSCSRTIDKTSLETTFSSSNNTVTWYETPYSIKAKMSYAHSKGITQSSFWAFGYY